MITLRMIEVDRFALRLIKNPTNLEFFHMKTTKDKVNFDIKKKLKYNLLTKLKAMSAKKKNAFIDEYLVEYRKQEENRKLELMQYAIKTN